MPLCQCTKPEGLLKSGRQSAAAKIAHIRADTMGVPPSLVTIVVRDAATDRFSTAGERSEHPVPLATVRNGHDVVTREGLLGKPSDVWARVSGRPATDLIVSRAKTLAQNGVEEEGSWRSRTLPASGSGQRLARWASGRCAKP
jgi:phenylpyruvate tautomerase PptA (4-oxalocrotonate tautomerase family)